MSGLSHYQVCILQAVAWLSRHAGKGYCYPSQAALVKILTASYHIKRCRRTLNYELSDLERHGYIRRLRRTHEGENGQPVFASTLYALKKRALAFLGTIVKILRQAKIAVWDRTKKLVEEPLIDVRSKLGELLGSIKNVPSVSNSS